MSSWYTRTQDHKGAVDCECEECEWMDGWIRSELDSDPVVNHKVRTGRYGIQDNDASSRRVQKQSLRWFRSVEEDR